MFFIIINAGILCVKKGKACIAAWRPGRGANQFLILWFECSYDRKKGSSAFYLGEDLFVLQREDLCVLSHALVGVLLQCQRVSCQYLLSRLQLICIVHSVIQIRCTRVARMQKGITGPLQSEWSFVFFVEEECHLNGGITCAWEGGNLYLGSNYRSGKSHTVLSFETGEIPLRCLDTPA